ncbi:S66 peptidase family protein [Stigmatella aurantiaca]|nr:LD-carboxypeptidase family protein [Stigmatella aurantiaca DW4/3-1]
MKAPVRWQKPLPLRPRDTVHVVAPAGPFDKAGFEAGLAIIGQRYSPVYGPDLFSSHRYLAGQDSRRREELSRVLRDPQGRAIFAARGGYGSMRLLPGLPLAEAGPSALVGFSDITALHLALQAKGWVSLHGPVLTQLGKQPPEVHERLFQLLESPAPAPPLSGTDTYVAGTAEGPLLGGNLAVLTCLVGTPYLPSFEGAVLLLEDVGERPYRLDRMWTQLRLAGLFQQVRGIVLGDFTACEEKGAEYTSAEVLRSLAQEEGLPCAAGFPIGHGALNFPVPLGVTVRLEADKAQLSFLEGAVRE